MALPEAVERQLPRARAELMELCRQPSVAAQGKGIAETVALLRRLFEAEGGRVQAFEAGGNPVLGVEFPGRADRTLLFYNHYDVQPAEPFEEWTTPPFEPAVRDGKLYARGCADNKGDLVARLTAIRALKEANGGELPCRVKFVIEGEEEIGSPTFPAVMERHGRWFAADACIWEFGMKDEAERVLMYGGLKGICYLELRVRTAAVDMHSSLAPIVPNPAWRLIWALASLKGPDGRIAVEGFYDDVGRPSPRDLAAAHAIPFDAEAFKRLHGVARLRGEGTPELIESLLFEPTCTICGIDSGYAGEGSKTVLPRQARAKVDFRLVGRQDPRDIAAKVRRHLDRHGFSDVEIELLGPEHPYMTRLDHPFVELVRDTASEVYGGEVVLYPTSAGSGPMHPVGHALSVPIISTGVGYWGSRAHAPDENIRLADFRQGIDFVARLLERFGGSAS